MDSEQCQKETGPKIGEQVTHKPAYSATGHSQIFKIMDAAF